MWRYGAFVGAMLAMMPAVAGDQGASSRSREIVYAYYDQPQAYATIKLVSAASVTQVEICTDVCDAFGARLPADSPELWDAILLFKAVISRSDDDQKFGAKHRTEAADLLARMTRQGRCHQIAAVRNQALCVLGQLARLSAFEYAEVKYDEGNRCAVYRSLDARERVVRSKCIKVTP